MIHEKSEQHVEEVNDGDAHLVRTGPGRELVQALLTPITDDDLAALQATRSLDENLIAMAKRLWWLCAVQGSSGITRSQLIEFAGVYEHRGSVALDLLEAGGHIVAIDSERVRAGKRWPPESR